MSHGGVLRQLRLCRSSPFALPVRSLTRSTAILRVSHSNQITPRVGSTLLQHIGPLRRQYSAVADAPAASDTRSQQDASISKFSELGNLGVHPAIQDAITSPPPRGFGFEEMTLVQSATINAALTGKDMVAQAKTGTGKTLAFLVPVIQRLLTDNPELAASRGGFRHARGHIDIQSLIISPTRELAEQIAEEARKLVAHTGIVVQCAVGGVQRNAALQKMRYEGCHILVATPGRLNDLLEDPRSGVDAPNLKSLVLDEADRMLEVGFAAELEQIVDLLPNPQEVPRQNLLFSATIPQNVVSLAKKYIDPRNFEFVKTTRSDEVPTHDRIPQQIVAVRGMTQAFPTLLELLQRQYDAAAANPEGLPLKAIVYLPITPLVEMTTRAFQDIRRGVRLPPVYGISSKLTQAQRTRVTDAFKRANQGILVSSDVTARGMDFPNVSHVIQVGLPQDRDSYIHRLGRTGRAGKAGQGWLILPQDSLRDARRLLAGLPITPATDFECANFDPYKDQNVPPQFEATSSSFSNLDRDLLRDVYFASMNKINQQRLDDLHDWVRFGWKMQKPPAITRMMAQRRGLIRMSGLNITDSSHRGFENDDDNFATGFGADFGNAPRGGSRGGFGSRGGSRYGDRRGGGFDDRRGGGGSGKASF